MSELAYRDRVAVHAALDLQGMESHILDVKDTQGFLAMDLRWRNAEQDAQVQLARR